MTMQIAVMSRDYGADLRRRDRHGRRRRDGHDEGGRERQRAQCCTTPSAESEGADGVIMDAKAGWKERMRELIALERLDHFPPFARLIRPSPACPVHVCM